MEDVPVVAIPVAAVEIGIVGGVDGYAGRRRNWCFPRVCLGRPLRCLSRFLPTFSAVVHLDCRVWSTLRNRTELSEWFMIEMLALQEVRLGLWHLGRLLIGLAKATLKHADGPRYPSAILYLLLCIRTGFFMPTTGVGWSRIASTSPQFSPSTELDIDVLNHLGEEAVQQMAGPRLCL